MSLTTLFLIAALGVFSASAEVMFSAKATVRVANGYYNATVYYLHTPKNTYLRYDYTDPIKMTELIDYSEGKKYKVCTKCETSFYNTPPPTLFNQTTDIPTGISEGQCKEYIPKDTDGMYSIWYKDDGTLCKAVLPEGRTLIFTEIDATFSNRGYFDLIGNQCPAPVCKRVMDLVFVIDISGSVGSYHWSNTIKNFVYDLVDSFDIGADATMIGLLTYGYSAREVFRLSADREYIKETLKKASYTGGNTCTGCGINMGMDFLKDMNTHRTSLDPEKVMMVITDGYNCESENYPCFDYKPVCTNYSKKCIKTKCDGTTTTVQTDICKRYRNTTTCKKYKCETCQNDAWSSKCLKQRCTARGTTCAKNDTSYCLTAYPYCSTTNGVINQYSSGYRCVCSQYKCAEYACTSTTCDAYDCANCLKNSTTCLEYEQECVENYTTTKCNGKETCEEYECIGGTIECTSRSTSYYNDYGMLTGAIIRTRTEWALWPATKRLPIVIAIGVGSVWDKELRAIPSVLQGKQLVYMVGDFNSLSTLLTDLVDETCVSQTENVDLCGEACQGLCGCNKECYCPTCDNATGSCYSIECKTDGKTSTGCVATHKNCSTTNKCLNVRGDNSTNDCCVFDSVNCKKSESKCRIYGCNKDEGCTDDPVVCTPSSACFNVTCDPSKGCVETPACPDLGPCKIMSCAVENGKAKCTYTDKCSSSDPCRLPRCNNETGECYTVPKVCTPKNGCYEAHCYKGACIDEVNVTKSIECSSLATGTCEEGYCNLETGTCETKKIEDTDACENCGQNKTLGCDERVDECFTYKCAAGDEDGSEYPTKCVEKDIRCFSNNPCVNKTCVGFKCITSSPCDTIPRKDACESYTCVADPTATLGYRCESSSTVPEDEDPCWRYSCNASSGEPIKESKCKQSKCTEFVGCAVVDGEAKCSYNQNHNCTSNMCNIITCNDETGQCETVENKTECNKYACKAYVCYNSSGCDYSEITCDDNDPCTIDTCIAYAEFSISDFITEGITEEDIKVINYTDSPDSLPHVCVHVPRCPSTGKFCERSSCNVFGNCTHSIYQCEDKNRNSTLDECHTYKCDEEKGKCVATILPAAFLDVCGSCLQNADESEFNETIEKVKCIGGMKMPEFTAAIGGAAVAGIVIAAIIVAAILGVSSALGTKELIKRAKKNADVGTNSNPLYEGNDNEASNPAFTGEN